ncbi:hypothetical protein HYC85_011207 [Camellia sinensis]|uniref:Uncharacterized protein n=1 Tax=Camellia sinensis TaxID=4442 RepID=A0A7J7HK96_CAMSI|nr:hypothetical protein HYC85_011207 [Camellia sinensis]
MSLNILISFGEEYHTPSLAPHSPLCRPLRQAPRRVPSLTDFLKSSFSLTIPEDDIVVRRFKDLKKRKCDDPVAHGALFIRDLGFLSKFSRSEILHGIDGEDDVKELREEVSGLGKIGVKFRLAVSVPKSDDFGMTKEWEELNAIFKRWEPDTIVLKGVPRRWFAEPRVSSKPSMLVTHTIFSTFGKISSGIVGEQFIKKIRRVLVSPLERQFDAQAGFCCCLSARAAVRMLEHEFPSLSILVVCRKFWESVSGARADLWTLEREPVSDARAGCYTLERTCFYISP